MTASHLPHGSPAAIPNGSPTWAPTYGTYGTDGESGCERENPAEVNAHTSTAPRKLAYDTACRYCGDTIYIALCSDGRWRTFDLATHPAAPVCIWAWRKHQGMQEQELIPGKRLHYCAAYTKPNLAPWDRRPA